MLCAICHSMKPSFVSKFLTKHNLFTHIRRENDNYYSLSIGDVHSSRAVRVSAKLFDFGRVKLGVQVDAMEPTIQFSWAVPGLQLWISFSSAQLPAALDGLVRRVKHRYAIEYAAGCYVDKDGHEPDLVVQWNFGLDPDSHESKESKLRRNLFWLRDTIQGRQHIETIYSEKGVYPLLLPEGPLAAELTIDHCVRWRQLGPAVKFTSASFKFERPVSVGDHKDREWTGSSVRGETADEMCRNMVQEIVRRRLRNHHTPDGARTLHSVMERVKVLETLPNDTKTEVIGDLAAFLDHYRCREEMRR